ncbi:MAG: ATP synthase F1 subunit delta [Alphaproteobacteria bacterium]|nr:ATP synthase F1 subunit delta [Alphaproteobacteria bacterium]
MSQETSISEVAKRYARATYELANTEGSTSQVSDDLISLKELIINNKSLLNLISSPTFTSQEQSAVFDGIFKKQKISKIVQNLTNVLIRNRRLNALVSVSHAFEQIMKENSGEIVAEVTAVSELSKDQLNQIKDNLKKMTGKEVQLETNIEPNILGGMMIDASVSTKLNNLKILMKGAN